MAKFKTKKFTEHKVCVLIFTTTESQTFLILKEFAIEQSMMYIGLHVKYPLFLSDFDET
jgi:hypothetical protein